MFRKCLHGLAVAAGLLTATVAQAQFNSGSNYNTANMSFQANSTISQDIVFDSNMQAGGTFDFTVNVHGGGGRPLQHDTGNIKLQFYTSSGALVTSAQTSYTNNLLQMNAWSSAPGDNSEPWSTLSLSYNLTAADAASVAYVKVTMIGTDSSWWAGNYGPQWQMPTLTFNGGSTNILYNPEFGVDPGNVQAQGWASSTNYSGVCGVTSGSATCVTNATGVTANMSGGGYSATGGSTSGTPGGYSSTLTSTTILATVNNGGVPPSGSGGGSPGPVTNNSGTTASNPSGTTVTTVTNTGTYTNDGTTGAVTNNTGGAYTNNGTGGDVTNAGTFTNGANGTVGAVTNTGTFTNNNVTGAVTNSGTFNNNGTTGDVINQSAGTFNNNSGGTTGSVNNAGTFNNSGTVTTVTNTGTFTNNTGGVTGSVANNYGSFYNSGTTGAVTNSNGGVFNNYMAGVTGNVTNGSASTFNNAGTVGTVNNSGTFANNATGTTGAFTNTGTLTNAGTVASLISSGTATNSGTITGAVNNTGTLTNNGTAGDVANGGTFTNAAGATINDLVNDPGAVTTNNGTIAGIITNNGTLTNTGTAGIWVNNNIMTNSGTMGDGTNTGTMTSSGDLGGVTNSGTFTFVSGNINSITNSSTLDVSGLGGSNSLGAFTQTSTGNVIIDANKQYTVIGAANLGGTVTINNAPTAVGRYTYLSAGSINGEFAGFTASPNSNGYLKYSGTEVKYYVTPDSWATMTSIDMIAADTPTVNDKVMNNIAGVLGNDCSAPGLMGGCMSVGYGTSLGNGDLQSGSITVSKAIDPRVRLGVTLGENFTPAPKAGTVEYKPNFPVTGGFIGVTTPLDYGSLDVMASVAAQRGEYTITRPGITGLVSNSEAGVGHAQTNGTAAQLKVTYSMPIDDSTTISPYIGIRQSQMEVGGYIETGNAFPLTAHAFNTSSSDVIAGVGVTKKLTDKLTASVGVGVTQNVGNSAGKLTGTSEIGGMSAYEANMVNGGKSTSASVGAGLSYEVAPGQKVTASVGWQDKTMFKPESTTVGLTWSFSF